MDATGESTLRLRRNESMLRLEGVSKRYPDGTVAVQHLDLDVIEGELVVLVGPSGCGKSTTLKMVNRLIEPTTGTISLQGEDVTRVDPVQLRRRMGYVIQHVGLFPHQTVAANVATVPRLLGWDKRRVKARVHELLELVGLDPGTYAQRYPSQLSGGQRQRVGVARALAADPPVLLMDEPFGAVDPIVRDRLQTEFLRLQQDVRKTILFVTHDIEEAVRLGDRIAVFSPEGRIEQYASPATILGRPASPFVADLVGTDRGLKRLSVTPIDPAALTHPATVHPDDRPVDVAALMRKTGCLWVAVLEDDGTVVGWIAAEDVALDADLRSTMRRVEASVPVDASLKTALSELLKADTSWLAVVDQQRFVGVLTADTVHETLRRATVA